MKAQDSLLDNAAWQKTRSAFVWSSILNTPFWAVFNMLPFILYKDLKASALQVTVLIILKPAVSLVALYWSALIEKRTDRLVSNLIWARVLSHLPFFLFPFVDNPWFFIVSFGFYMMLARGTIPAWMEVLKLNIPAVSRERVFAYATAIGYVGAAVIPFTLGGIMDTYAHSWRWIFPVAAFISLGSILFKYKIPIYKQPEGGEERKQFSASSFHSWNSQITKPWKSAWQLIRRRSDYTRYQLGFMLGGSGLIIIQPALPGFFMDGLNLSYTGLAVALTLCKGIGFALTSPTWARLMNRIDIYRFNSWVTLLAFVFPFCLLAAQFNVMWLYAGYLLYGVMQAGSEMSWNLSGPLFAKEEDSSVYSNVNILTVGLRGCFVPVLGTLLANAILPFGVMLVGAGLCLLSAVFMSHYSRQVRQQTTLDIG